MIAIIDYGMGNLRSVQKAFERLGAAAAIYASPAEMPQDPPPDKLVLPGVGAFADGMAHLQQRGWIDAIRQFAASGKPFLGICLGMQLLFDGSEEDAPAPGKLVPGLGLLPGSVVRFQESDAPDGQRFKIPHMGWNSIRWHRPDPLLKRLPQDASVYFVHSYYVQPRPSAGQEIVSASTEYPEQRPFCSSVWRGNLWATQFHPEKSQQVGQTILENFAGL